MKLARVQLGGFVLSSLVLMSAACQQEEDEAPTPASGVSLPAASSPW